MFLENPPEPVVTRAEVAKLLDLRPSALARLTTTGFMSNLTARRVADLCAAPVLRADEEERQPVLRQASRKTGTGTERDRGINAEMSPEAIAEQCLGWWIVNEHAWLDARFIPVTIATFCVAVLAVDGVDEYEESTGAVFFAGACVGFLTDLADLSRSCVDKKLDERDADIVRMMLGSRLFARSGGPAAYLDTAGRETDSQR